MESINININDLCRLCGSENGIKINIFQPGEEYVRKIHEILPITVSEEDALPKHMCHRCSYKVDDFNSFRDICTRTYNMFKTQFPWPQNSACEPMTTAGNDLPDPTNEKSFCKKPNFLDAIIVIDDDEDRANIQSNKSVGNELENNHDLQQQEKIVLTIKKSDIIKKRRRKSKKKRKTTLNPCKIAQVYTTTMDEYHQIDELERDPLGFSPERTDNCENINYKINQIMEGNDKNLVTVAETVKSAENLTLPAYIYISDLPHQGRMYTCLKCKRIFLSPQSACSHDCCAADNPKNFKPNNNNQTPSSVGKLDCYICQICDKVFSRKSLLNTHQKRHVQEAFGEIYIDETYSKKRRKTVKNKPRSSTSARDKIKSKETEILQHSLLSSDSECS